MDVRIVSGRHHPRRLIQMRQKWPLPSASASTSAAWQSRRTPWFHRPSGKHDELGNLCLCMWFFNGKSKIQYHIQYLSMTIIQNPAMNKIWNKLHINNMFSILLCFIDVVDSHAHCEFIVMFICPIFGCLFLACTHASHPLNEHQNMIIFLGKTLDFAYPWHVDVITHSLGWSSK